MLIGGRRERSHRLAAIVNQAVDEEREADHGEKTADANRAVRVAAGKRDEDHQAEADAHQRDAGAAVPSGTGADFMALDALHDAIEAARVDFGRGNQTALDHRNALADFELPHPPSHDRMDDRVNERADNGRDRNPERADDHVVQLRLPAVLRRAGLDGQLIRLVPSVNWFTPPLTDEHPGLTAGTTDCEGRAPEL